MRLLLIEDDPALQTSPQRTLERRGMHVLLCADGAQAVAQWQQQAPDLVLLDLSLPGLDGLEVLDLAVIARDIALENRNEPARVTGLEAVVRLPLAAMPSQMAQAQARG